MNSIELYDEEYFYITKKRETYQFVTNCENYYDGKILEVILCSDNIIKIKLKNFERNILQDITYLKRDGEKTIKLAAKDNKGWFEDIYDHNEFHISSRGIYEFRNISSYLPATLNRIEKLILESKEKVKKVEL